MQRPLHRVGPGAPAVVAVGDAELPELIRQADEYATPDGAMLAALHAIAPRWPRHIVPYRTRKARRMIGVRPAR